MNDLDLNQVVGTQLTEDGVGVLTHGAMSAMNVRENLRNLLKHADRSAYANYREIKYPGGKENATHETRIAATRFLFDSVRDLLEPHYLSAPSEGISSDSDED